MKQNLFSDAPYTRRISQLTSDQLDNIDAYLQELLAKDSALLKQTHHFHGRFENIYLAQHDHADLTQLMAESVGFCAEMLDVSSEELSISYWFNLMQPGDVTTLHRHDDFDELISGVVYLKVPENSGDLILQAKNQDEIILTPISGNYIYFDPKTPHAVGENQSDRHRLSIGMNLGLKANKIDHPSPQ
jgi:hypothetical protein